MYPARTYTARSTRASGVGLRAQPDSDADADSEISVVSHEHMESVTDPFVNTLLYAAWYDAYG